MKSYRILVIILLLLGIEIQTFSQTYRMESYNTQSGLLSDHINDIAQDYDGRIWISTAKGLSIFDGLKFENHLDSNNLFPISAESRIKVIAPNELVIAGFNFASHFVARHFIDSKWSNLSIPDSLSISLSRIWDAQLVGGALHMRYINNNTLYSYSSTSNSWRLIPLPESLSNSYKKLLIQGSKTILLCQSGIYEVEHEKWKEVLSFTAAQQKKNPVEIFYENDLDSTIWIGGDNWLCQLKDGKILPNLLGEYRTHFKIRQIRKGSNGFLFFKSEKSIFWYHKLTNTIQAFTPQSDDVGVFNARILVDKENGLWITSYRGLHHIPSFLFLGYSKGKELIESEVSLVSELPNNEYLVGFHNSYEILRNDTVVYLKRYTSLKNGSTRLIFATKDTHGRTYLAGHQLGVGILQEDHSLEWTPYKDSSIVLTQFLKDTLWAATTRGNLYYVKDKKYIQKARFNDYARSICLLDNGSLLVCARNGIQILSGSSIKKIDKYDDLSIQQSYCAFLYNDKIFLGTEGGLAILENNQVKKTTINGKQIDRAIYSIIKGREGIWFGTDNGVYLLQDTMLTHFDESSGLVGWEVNRGAFLQDSKGRMVIGTNKGLNFYDPLHTENKILRYEPIIKWIRTHNKIFLNNDSINLSYNENFITIGLQAISYTGKPVEFRYRMIGYQDAWLQLSSSDVREITFRSLPPGDFTFEFQARLGNSAWSQISKSQQIHIATPFYRSYGFFLLILLVAAAVGYGVHWIFTNQRAREKLKHEIEKSLSELRKSETKLELALENSKMGVWIYSFDLNRAEYSNEMFDILNLPQLSETLTKENYLSIVYEADKDRVNKELKYSLKNRKPYDVEFRISLKDGTLKWLHLKGKATYKSNGDPEIFSGTLNDISTRKALEGEREMMISELEKTNKELDRFIYSVSHDLSAPIKSIQGLINLTRMESLTNDAKQYLNLIERSITRQNLFIKEIIEYGRNSRAPIQSVEVNVASMINDIIEDLKYSEHYLNTDIHIHVDPEVRIITCDSTRLKIILNNLLSNAIKFKSKYKESHEVRIAVLKTDENFSITVEDNGIGIDSKHLNKLFTMFYRATDQQPGSGIGLYIAHEAAKKMGLALTVSSTYGEGATFTLR